ncbi:MAG: hypothetical protein NVSMB27_37610 [Ktedonobacteraceae bacterium]
MAVRNSIREKIRQRSVVKLNVFPSTLTERGILMEEREYLIAHRGVSTVFIYVAPAGQDLYISRATTVLPAINNVRVALLIGIPLLAIFGCSFLANTAPILAFTSLLIVPAFILFALVLLVRSFIFWLIEKDFWAYLRSNVLNDFQLDDIALLEHVTDDVVRSAVEEAGLDASKIVPPAQGYQPKPKIRAV